jgi:hypothetical protein
MVKRRAMVVLSRRSRSSDLYLDDYGSLSPADEGKRA